MKPGIGAIPCGDLRCQFRVWAPRARSVDVRLLGPPERIAPLASAGGGWWESVVEGVAPGALYYYRLDGEKERPDPASRLQPKGVHGPSEVVDPRFAWSDAAWRGRPLESSVFYEIHVGAFSPAGDFDGVAARLDELRSVGVNVIELMPVAQFPGRRNWGYDGVQLFAVQESYGGPAGLKRLVDACHARGVAVALDVVYNHLGPEGNYLADFGPYFSERHRTPWGPAINFDGPGSDDVRRFFVENALMWVTDFHIDALRVDAVHGIVDLSAQPFLAELTDEVRRRALELGRQVHVVAESDLNDLRVLRPDEAGGYGFDAQWNDDFHHALHVALTGERGGYYEDFDGLRDVVRALTDGFVMTGGYSAYRRRRHGMSSRSVEPGRFVVFSQNHDQVGNRAAGERLASLVPFEALKLAAAAVILAPCVPLLFMGEEYGETAPFQYFVSHSDPDLIEAVRRGRREEFSRFHWGDEPPDPQAPETFDRSRIRRDLKDQPPHNGLLAFYTELLRLRRERPALRTLTKAGLKAGVLERERVLWLHRAAEGDEVFAVFNFDGQNNVVAAAPLPPGPWRCALDSSEKRWGGPGAAAPASVVSEGRAELPCASHALAVFVRS